MTLTPPSILLEIALPVPLRRSFDYLPPTNLSPEQLAQLEPGILIRVPFGRQELIGILLRSKSTSDQPSHKLRPALALIDNQPVLESELLELCLWAADYYQCAPGEALQTALPVLLRQGEAAQLRGEQIFQLTTEGKGLPEGALKRSPKQAALLAALQTRHQLSRGDLEQLDIPRTIAKTLIDKGLVALVEVTPSRTTQPAQLLREPPLQLSDEQQSAFAQIEYSSFKTYLLDGATGSGKTEIYLQAIAETLKKGKQALVLVPEIGLTPQTLQRFQRRFNLPIVALHSGLNDRERLDAWLQARAGIARIIIGTRSALFTPLKEPGIIIIDEEHDGSFKQQDGFRYSARDLAALRAQRLGIPLILGSATPALETLHNARQGRYHHLRLQARAGNAKPPDIQLLDIRGEILHEGFAQASIDAIGDTLNKGNQALVFLNRRGYAPALECHDCGWLANCNHCDARLTVHQTPRHLHCHHCDHQRAIPKRCPSCNSSKIQPLGQGTERSELVLQELFPTYKVIRVDRDSTRNKNSMQKLLADVHGGEPCILVGTQMLAKGHHFEDVTLVVIIDADAGLFSTDFRGPERMGQLLLQVSGRAGRAEKPGRVILQSHHTDHPLVQTLVHQGYHALAELILQERQITQLPPYRQLALLRAECKQAQLALDFLQQARQLAEALQPPSPQLNYLGPLPAMMEKRGDRFRYQLQFSAAQRRPLQLLLSQLAQQLETQPLASKVRWSIDVDPQEMG
ncbi:primosomal protein N` [Cellvibrio sp. BR]|uniref:primosomal protein N' n=1 Tax=Cellvibrio sp. BR TaxID=1134474 RepID=UPI0002600940|nr:primosomal protein N' [Cellvibrio sp. BR]EIK43501.1 primosomal protein N` [Cellvibrio sp. BR]